MTKLEILRMIGFGSRVAEDETNELESYFVETADWQKVYSGDVDVVFGAKGSGKSALYSLLSRRSGELFDRGILLAPAENLRGTPVFSSLVPDPPASETQFVGLWKLYFLSVIHNVLSEYSIDNGHSKELRRALEAEGLIPKKFDLTRQLASVYRYVRESLVLSSVEGGVATDPGTGLPVGFTGKITFREPSDKDSESGFVSVDRLLQLASDACEEASVGIWILLDRLDVAFSDAVDLEENALRALFKVYLDLLAYPPVHVKVFLRTDIWQRITDKGFREASHITRCSTLAWDTRGLMALLCRRLLSNATIVARYDVDPVEVVKSTADQRALFYRVFPDKIDVGRNPDTFDWAVLRVSDGQGVVAPRELIHLFNAARDHQIKRLESGDDEPADEHLFTRPVFKDALVEVSETRLHKTLYAEYPSLKPRIEKLRGEKTRHSIETLAELWKLSPASTEKLVQQLVEVGFFKIQESKDASKYWVPYLYRGALELVQGTA